MTSIHRPLSTWVARLSPDGRLGLINDGRERADARTLPWFESPWTRTRVAAARPGQPPRETLALVEEGTGVVVVELDNYSTPLPVGEAGLAIIVAVERNWPDVTEEMAWSALADEPMPLRHLLLRRLTEEARVPLPPWLFHVLDWGRVEDLVGHLVARLTGATVDAPPIVLRHWYSPAVRGLTAALEQLDAGQRVGDRAAQRQGIESLFAAVRAGDPARLPRSTRTALTVLLGAIAAGTPMYRFAARSISRELAGEPTGREPDRRAALIGLTSPLLDPRLEPAAAEEDREQQSTTLGEAGYELTVTRTARGRLLVTASIAAAGDEDLPAFLAVRVTVPAVPDRDRSLWIALRQRRGVLTGTITLPLPPAGFAVTAAESPAGAAWLRYADPTELLESIRAGNHATQNAWLAAADQLPEGHPVREAGRRFEEEQ